MCILPFFYAYELGSYFYFPNNLNKNKSLSARISYKQRSFASKNQWKIIAIDLYYYKNLQ